MRVAIDLITYEQTKKSCKRNIKFDEVQKGTVVVMESKKLGESEMPNPITLGKTELPRGDQRRKQKTTRNQGHQLRDAMLSTGFSPTLLTYNALIQGLCKNTEERLAKELYKEMISKGISPDDNTIYSLIEGIPNVDEFLANDR
ncbi:pentatricopeptide repeat (PPR) superfamily protein [Artemisia annua]|uniref:Pentatricopeptide repeat (PPR) superfamily protein n=1 Tax=Artemisia annua TaxID=35608 RepID=A0A2U1LZR5_ARTAN|nr:pentatricopeptide repeat (PPR) superfamily protein [Artemisia annua]